jgi:hypothetical protein
VCDTWKWTSDVVQVAHVLLLILWRYGCTQLWHTKPKLRIHALYVFDDAPDAWVDDFHTVRMPMVLEGLEKIRQVTGYTHVRLEIRYTCPHGNKYRLVMRDVCWDDALLQQLHLGNMNDIHKDIRGPGSFISCQLDSVPPLDCTARMLKYAGPRGDFHGMQVRVLDMFPFLHKHEFINSYHTMTFLDSEIRMHRICLKDDPVMDIETIRRLRFD